MKNLKISYFSKEKLLEDCTKISSYLRYFGWGNDEENFVNLSIHIENNRLAIPVEIQEKIDSFIQDFLDPMIYTGHTIREYETIDDALNIGKFTEQKWQEFSMENLHPYLIN